MKLKDLHIEVLRDMRAAHDSIHDPLPWVRPLDIYGRSGSHHSQTLKTLEGRGLVQSKQRGWPDPDPGAPRKKLPPGWRGARVYRLTDAGRKALDDL